MNELKIGWACRDVSTEKPVLIPGQFHARVSQGIADPVTLTVLALENGSDMAVFLSADVVIFRSNMLERVRALVAEKHPGFPVEKILMNATHTHTGPSVYGERLSPQTMDAPSSAYVDFPHDDVDIESGEVYFEFFAAKAADAILEAYTKRAPGGIAYGYGYAVVGHSRRVVYFDDLSLRPGAVNNSTHGVNGHAAMYGSTRDDKFSHYEAGADPIINFLYTFDVSGNLTGAIVNVPCPAQNSEGESRLSASFWHEARQAIRARHGNVFLLAQTAAGGDLSPRILHYKEAQARKFSLKYADQPETISEHNVRRDIAERIESAFTETLAWARRDIQKAAPIAHCVKTIQLARRMITEQEYAEETKRLEMLEKEQFKQDGAPLDRLRHNSQLFAARTRCKKILTRHDSQEREPTLPMEMHAIRIGDIAFASNRFELYMDFMHRIQARSPFIQTFIVQLAAVPGDGGGTYLATERGVQGRGYSASRYCNVVSPKGGQQLVEETLTALKEIAKSDFSG